MTALGRRVRHRPVGVCHHVESFSLDLILRSRPDVVSTWDDTEVARRWLLICPVRKNSAGDQAERGLAPSAVPDRFPPEMLSTLPLRRHELY